MHDLFLVERIQTRYHLVENRPNVGFFHKWTSFLKIVYFSLQITTVAILHYDAKRARSLFEECFFVAGNIGMVDRC